MEREAHQDPRDQKAKGVRQAPQVVRVHPESPEKGAHPVTVVYLALWGMRVRAVIQESPDLAV